MSRGQERKELESRNYLSVFCRAHFAVSGGGPWWDISSLYLMSMSSTSSK